jgi:hypothetical protein
MQSQRVCHVPGEVDTLRALGLPVTEGRTEVRAEPRSVNRPVVVRGMVGAMLTRGWGSSASRSLRRQMHPVCLPLQSFRSSVFSSVLSQGFSQELWEMLS